MGQLWARVRRVWAIAGTVAFVVFTTWAVLAYRATGTAREALKGAADVAVTRGDGYWAFRAKARSTDVGLVFFAGALVDPRAYAPLMLEVAREGFPALLVELPRRGAFGGAEGPVILTRARRAMTEATGVVGWVVGGHSRGGVVAAQFARTAAADIRGLALVGTSHPRDFSLARLTLPVVQIYGTRDTVADVDKVDAALQNLPRNTRRVRIDGGNHSQFGYYGFQPGDWPATISRDAQQQRTRDALVATLREAAAGLAVPGGS